MTKQMIQTLTEAMAAYPIRHSKLSIFISKRLISTSTNSITTITCPSPLPSLLFSRRSVAPLSHAVQSLSLPTTRFSQIRCRVNRSGNSSYSPLNSGSNFSDRPPTEMAPLFPGCDYEHWLIVMDKPGGEGATKQQMIDCYIKTLAQVLGRWYYFFHYYYFNCLWFVINGLLFIFMMMMFVDFVY